MARPPLIPGVDYYVEDGKFVFLPEYHLKRGHCCNSKCRHCPYGLAPADAPPPPTMTRIDMTSPTPTPDVTRLDLSNPMPAPDVARIEMPVLPGLPKPKGSP